MSSLVTHWEYPMFSNMMACGRRRSRGTRYVWVEFGEVICRRCRNQCSAWRRRQRRKWLWA